ncbi:FAD-dependent monooxygenase [Arthrobacter sp. SLBN-53]|uniref:FAD-dependent oxidoreductase n=1 Tax=Arthrobacter sp. SLBN-53 TaxID=2768412 RepID=UPI00115263F1|nr:FAD-dependent monooxygenase [Arthrobacter sp. SLBN-53]TQK31261.1 flavin-dependent dehydrogenase [Arthrobacter sp. SLBN-53]
MAIVGERAVVLGGSIAGLLAARVLAEHYRSVTIVERDDLTEDPDARRGVSHFRYGRVLPPAATVLLAELFPGFEDDLAAEGVPSLRGDTLTRLHIHFGGHRLAQHRDVHRPDAATLHFPSSGLVERTIRRRVQAMGNVTILDDRLAIGLAGTADASGITGVEVAHGRTSSVLDADLVVDATGRASRTPVLLEQLGYSRPPEDDVIVKLAYASQRLQMPSDAIRERMVAFFPEPERPSMWSLVCHEKNTWTLTVGSMAGHPPPAGRPEMLAIGDGLIPDRVLAAVRAATPVGEAVHFRVPSNRWRRYDKLRRFPRGLLVIGDAICSVNPIYGQGLTLSAIEATILRDCLRHGDDDLGRRFFRACTPRLRMAWSIAVGSDLALPEVDGHRRLWVRVAQPCLAAVSVAAETDPHVAVELIKVTGMLDSPSQLMRPAFVRRVVRANRTRRGSRSEGNRDPRRTQLVPQGR